FFKYRVVLHRARVSYKSIAFNFSAQDLELSLSLADRQRQEVSPNRSRTRGSRRFRLRLPTCITRLLSSNVFLRDSRDRFRAAIVTGDQNFSVKRGVQSENHYFSQSCRAVLLFFSFRSSKTSTRRSSFYSGSRSKLAVRHESTRNSDHHAVE